MIHPGFFGPDDRQLLGLYHPAEGTPRRAGVLVCNPAPQEQLRSHWALRKLADHLAASGFDVLRFDYRGTGDSAGSIAGVMPSDWVADVGLAADELRALASVDHLSAVGLRLGAYIAAAACSSGLALETLVLWEPVLDGASYLAELTAMQQDQHRKLLRPPAPGNDGLFGLELDARQLAAWAELDVTTLAPWPARRAELIVDLLEPSHGALASRCRSHALANAPAAGLGSGRAMLGNAGIDLIAKLLAESA